MAMKFAVVGVGGVGGYFGARLAEAGEDVTFIARGEHLQAMARHGLRVSSIAGDVTIAPIKATDSPAAMGVVDCIVVAVKGWQLPEVASQLHPMMGPATVVLPLLNGVESHGTLAAELGAPAVLEGLCNILAWREAPGVIRHGGVAEPGILFGEHDNEPSERVTRLRDVFGGCRGVRVGAPADIHVAVWSKFMFICAMSGIGALCRAPIGTTRRLSQTRALIEAMVLETDTVARALGVDLPEDAVGRTWRALESMPEDGTASLQRDVMAGRPSELESQLGAVVRLGQRAGVATPVNALVYAALLPQELAART